MLTAMLQGRTPSLSLKPLQIVDALVRKKLVLAPWADARCLRLVYEPPALVATLARRLWAVPAPEDPSHA
jgi:hypothetical protein